MSERIIARSLWRASEATSRWSSPLASNTSLRPERPDDLLPDPAALADALDEIQVTVAAGRLLANKHADVVRNKSQKINQKQIVSIKCSTTYLGTNMASALAGILDEIRITHRHRSS